MSKNPYNLPDSILRDVTPTSRADQWTHKAKNRGRVSYTKNVVYLHKNDVGGEEAKEHAMKHLRLMKERYGSDVRHIHVKPKYERGVDKYGRRNVEANGVHIIQAKISPKRNLEVYHHYPAEEGTL